MKHGLRFLMALALLAGIATFSGAALADVEINETNFPDIVFRSLVGMYYDGDGDGVLSEAEAESVTGINVAQRGIADLTGIEYFPEIFQLNCENNYITFLDLSANAKLDTLLCHNNRLEDLNVRHCPELALLICINNRLTALDVSRNPALVSLECGENQLAALDVSRNAALRTLGCGNNRLTSMDIRDNPLLEQLLCDGNQLTALDLSHNPELYFLDCESNQLESLDLSGSKLLKVLYCHSNLFADLDVSLCTELVRLVQENEREVLALWDFWHNEDDSFHLQTDHGVTVTAGELISIPLDSGE